MSNKGSNIINAGDAGFAILDKTGEEVEYINPFNKIVGKYLDSKLFTSRTSAETIQWFKSNFTNWIKRGAPDVDNDLMDPNQFRKLFYVPLEDYIKDILDHETLRVEQGKLDEEQILLSLPEYVRKNPKDAVVFSNGRMFLLKNLTHVLSEVEDFLNAVVQNREHPNEMIMPSMFMVRDLSQLQVPEAIKRSVAWHTYTQQQAEKISKMQCQELIDSLQEDVDYKILDTFDEYFVVQMLTSRMAEAEGRIMKHCVASYGRDIELNKTTVLSVRDNDNYPVATIEIKDKHARQVKGPNNTTIKPEAHETIREFFWKHKYTVGRDEVHFGGMKTPKKANVEKDDKYLYTDE